MKMDAMGIIILILSIIAIIISVVSIIKIHKLPGKINKDPTVKETTAIVKKGDAWDSIKIVPLEHLSLIMLGKYKWFIVRKKLPEKSLIEFDHINKKYMYTDPANGKKLYRMNPYTWFLQWLDTTQTLEPYVVYEPSYIEKTNGETEIVWRNNIDYLIDRYKNNKEMLESLEIEKSELEDLRKIIMQNFWSLDMKNHLLIGDLYNPVFTTNPIEIGPKK